ncbi:hypothetical protein CYD30_29030 [Kosakonia cowanii]|nr:hypothetical protein CYD30_29030 [Kosakonia cowanii]
MRQTGVATDGMLRMAVRTWVEGKDPDLWVSVVLSLRLSSVDNNRVNIDVQVEQDEPIRVFITRTDEEAREEVVESIKRHIQAALKKRYPPAYL